jgi:hypothetical protein
MYSKRISASVNAILMQGLLLFQCPGPERTKKSFKFAKPMATFARFQLAQVQLPTTSSSHF